MDCLSSFRETHVGGVVSATTKSRKQYSSRRKLVPRQAGVDARLAAVEAKYEHTAAGSKDGHNADFQSRMTGAVKGGPNYDKYHTDKDNYDKYLLRSICRHNKSHDLPLVLGLNWV